MSGEREPRPEPAMTEAQTTALRGLCDRYGVEFDQAHYTVHADGAWYLPGYAEGWVGGAEYANPQYYRHPDYKGRHTIFVGVSPEGQVSS
jgi:hypothetical protein